MTKDADRHKDPDLVGVVQSLAAPDFISAEPGAKFTFTVLSGNIMETLYAELSEPGMMALVPIVCAAFQTQLEIQIFRHASRPNHVSWVQIPKPRKG